MSTAEKHQFQAEIEQVLDIVIHSLYTDKEIFVRELVSNAADACEKLRFLQTSGQAVFEPDRALGIAIATDEKAGTITITDTGVGMTRDELVENLGTVAHSGSRAFLKKLAEDKKTDAKLIGQFGVGFYAAFMVASKVTVLTRSCQPDQPCWSWTSEGAGGYTIEPAEGLPRGTKIVLELTEAQKDFAKDFTIERILKRYSNFVPFPIELNGKATNTTPAIWTRPKNEIKEEEYQEFYRYISHDTENSLYRLHFAADAPLVIQTVLYVPSKNIELLGMMRMESDVHLYCRKVLIDAKPKGLLPEWLRFLKGVVDSEDLPLNISRETMQDSSLVQKLNQVITGRFLKFLEEQSEKDPASYEQFYAQFGRYLKEGVVNDYNHHDALGKLLRFESSTLDAGKKTSLAEYIKRMTGDQKEVYYLLAPSREAALSSPAFEVFRSKNYEVLLLDDPWDEFVMDHLREFDGKSLKAAEKAELSAETPKEGGLDEEKAKALAEWMKAQLNDRVAAVKPSQRLVDSPAILGDKDKFMTASMRRLMKAMKNSTDAKEEGAQYELEINPRHNLIVRLNQLRESDPALASQVAEQLLDNAKFAAGLIENPNVMLKRMNELLERVVGPKS
jgi:TNF receptor-associated protein 1